MAKVGEQRSTTMSSTKSRGKTEQNVTWMIYIDKVRAGSKAI